MSVMQLKPIFYMLLVYISPSRWSVSVLFTGLFGEDGQNLKRIFEIAVSYILSFYIDCETSKFLQLTIIIRCISFCHDCLSVLTYSKDCLNCRKNPLLKGFELTTRRSGWAFCTLIFLLVLNAGIQHYFGYLQGDNWPIHRSCRGCTLIRNNMVII